jgi:hypothetical protein
MKISNKYLYTILAFSILLNVMAGIYGLRIIYSRVSEKWEAKTINDDTIPYSSILHYDLIPPHHRTSRTTILNTLIERHNYHSYLEIGQGHRGQNFGWINCRIKIGVDPNKTLNAAYQMTSDEFFAINNDMFGLIFIDGLHHADQVERDIINALNVLNDNGTIVVHDCNPTTKEMQIVPLPRGQAAWTGDVWKTWVKLRATRPDLKMVVIDTDSGCGIIRRGSQKIIELPERLTYEALDKNREKFLNLVDVNFFLKDLKAELPSHNIQSH